MKRNEHRIKKQANQSLFELLPNKNETKKQTVVITSTQKGRRNMGKAKIDTFKNSYGMRLIEENLKVDPNLLTANRPYQRKIQRRAINILKESIQDYGEFWAGKNIIVNPDYEIVDGQHRWVAAKELGMKNVPITVYDFPSIEVEARFFRDGTRPSTKQPPIEFWDASFIAGDPLAKVIYKLEDSPTSFLQNKVALKHKNTPNIKFTIAQVQQILFLVLSNKVTHYKKETSAILYKSIDRFSYPEIEARCNVFVKWFYDAFGEDKKANPIAYGTTGLYAIIGFYHRVREAGHLHKDSSIVSHKMSSYPFTSEFRRLPFEAKRESLINYYNQGRKNKIRFNE